MPREITQCYLPPGRGYIPALGEGTTASTDVLQDDTAMRPFRGRILIDNNEVCVCVYCKVKGHTPQESVGGVPISLS